MLLTRPRDETLVVKAMKKKIYLMKGKFGLEFVIFISNSGRDLRHGEAADDEVYDQVLA